ncbi:MAG: AMP-binding protein, partial [Acidimicrobiales bacterium]
AIDFAEKVAAIGVDEIAALVDFGIDGDTVLANLQHLNAVRAAFLEEGSTHDQTDTYGSLIAEHGVTHFQCTPSEARIVLAELESREALGSLQRMLVGGEACPVSVARELHEAVGGQLINVYGPTETTIWSTIHAVTPADLDEDSIPIGAPLNNTTVRIVSEGSVVEGSVSEGSAVETGQLRPAGRIGELLIGGEGVTRGYHAREDLTAERFVEREDTSGRVYRTGDLVSWRPDGNLAFHGRADSQVKVRGHRIELGEIECALEERDDIGEAAVVVHGEGDTAKLVAHLVARGDSDTEFHIREALGVALPAHMVPERIMWHDVLPTTPNGKVDRKTLATVEKSADPSAMEPAAAEATVPVTTAAPTPLPVGAGNVTELATIIDEAWQHVLGTDKIDRFKSFFDHGGNSLQVVTLRDTLTDRLDRPVSLIDLFRYGSVNQLAEAFAAKDEPDPPEQEPLSATSAVSAGTGDRASRRAAARRNARKTK